MCTGQIREGKMWEEVILPKVKGHIFLGEEVDFSRINHLLWACIGALSSKLCLGTTANSVWLQISESLSKIAIARRVSEISQVLRSLCSFKSRNETHTNCSLRTRCI